MLKKLETYFEFQRRGTTLGTEFRAGTTTFMTMAYILVVQPIIMSACGMPAGAVFTATAIMTAASTIMMGLYAKLPFALSTAMGTNAIFAYSIVGAGKASWETALGMIFWSGIAFMFLSIPLLKPLKWVGLIKNEKLANFSFREAVTNNIPTGLKLGLGAAVGVFLLGLGMGSSGMNLIGKAADGTVIINNLANPAIIVGIVGLLVTAGMFWLKGKKGFHIPGAILIGIITITVVMWITSLAQMPASIISAPPSMADIAFKLDIWGALKVEYAPFIFVFFLGDFFSTTGTAIGCGMKAGFMDKKTGKMPGLDQVFVTDSTFTVVGSVAGLSTITTFVESASGVEEGGRTGLTSLVTAFWFLVALFFSPLFLAIPGVATGAALAVVGLSMMECLKDIPWKDPVEWVPVCIMVAVTGLTSDFASALCVSLIFYAGLSIIRRYVMRDKDHPVTVMTLVLLVMSIAKFIITV